MAGTLCDVLENLRAGIPEPPPAGGSAGGVPRDVALAREYCRSLRQLVEGAIQQAEAYRASLVPGEIMSQ